MSKRKDPFAVAGVDVEPETRKDRIKRHGLDPHDTRYTGQNYGQPIGMPKPLNPKFIAAQRRIEGIIHDVRLQHPELDFREAWRFAAEKLGIDLDAIPVWA